MWKITFENGFEKWTRLRQIGMGRDIQEERHVGRKGMQTKNHNPDTQVLFSLWRYIYLCMYLSFVYGFQYLGKERMNDFHGYLP